VTGTGPHAHGPEPGADARWLSGALALILAFMAGEVAAGLAANSLALLSDAAHMLTDAAAIALVLITARLAAGPRLAGTPTDSSVPRFCLRRPTASPWSCSRPGSATQRSGAW
jgi:hypothetical protein